MKKAIVLLMVLILTGPTIGLACDCCPMTGPTSDHSQIVRAAHDCCPMIDMNRERCGVERTNDISLPIFSETLASIVTLNSEIFSILSFSNSSLNEEKSPLFSSETPLYLTYRSLRL